MTKTKRMVLLSTLVAIALVIYLIEAQIPVLFPGIKLGLANSISLVALILLGWREAFLIMFLRTLLGSIFGGGMPAFMFSLAGGILSNIIMILLYKYLKKYISIPTISVCGAVFHNIGQLLVAGFIINNLMIYVYLPVLLIAAIVTGYFIGILSSILISRLEKILPRL
ncbi:Gx transporter family protein [Clostridium estertheticum]|uniref:Gx transporter family protein n=1 Tax=Clostridium estertheticum TaxID=238834 RepID=UPI001C0C05A7|nr:Gx transporter family protein [Clostridium estertheticum]MBU3175449.1 Gx transporter family protein [Clostridium estertheticum]MBX4263927.1 Gx transporter family protein [Clostridium estertheticum]MBX4268133.1 Gx transporter family protein [Clostridium estertheticum]MCB2355103.1 Gx transporter family protein [Clostridium estertheticum]MCB2360444.1 Gx transporter family protein [Clostridium estertheticum]